MLFEGQKRPRAWPDLELLWYGKMVSWARVVPSPCVICHFGKREALIWGEDARAVQLHWLCFAGAPAVGTAELGDVCTGSVSCLRAQQQPGLHHSHSGGQPIFRQANPVLLSFVSRSAQTLFVRSASFVRQSFRVNVKLFSLPSCFKSLVTNGSVVLESS